MLNKTTNTKNNETIIHLNNSRFIALEPSLENLVNKPTPFILSLFESVDAEAVGTYKFNRLTQTTNTVNYTSANIKSKKTNAQIPKDLINTSNKILSEIASKQRLKNHRFSLEHTCNFYIMRHECDVSKFDKIINLYKNNNYKFSNNIEASKQY